MISTGKQVPDMFRVFVGCFLRRPAQSQGPIARREKAYSIIFCEIAQEGGAAMAAPR
jgi:hypothetical protein